MAENSKDNESESKGITNDLRQYVEKRLELIILTVSDHLSFILADSLQRLIGILLLAGGLLIAWFALSYYISSLVDSYALGFFLSSLPLIVGGIIFIKSKPQAVTRAIQAGIIDEVMLSFDKREEKQNTKRDLKNKEGESIE